MVPTGREKLHPNKRTEKAAHPDQKRRVENVLNCPGKGLWVDDKLVIQYRRRCCDGNRDA